MPYDADLVFCAAHLVGARKGGSSFALTTLATNKVMRVGKNSILDFFCKVKMIARERIVKLEMRRITQVNGEWTAKFFFS